MRYHPPRGWAPYGSCSAQSSPYISHPGFAPASYRLSTQRARGSRMVWARHTGESMYTFLLWYLVLFLCGFRRFFWRNASCPSSRLRFSSRFRTCPLPPQHSRSAWQSLSPSAPRRRVNANPFCYNFSYCFCIVLSLPAGRLRDY